LRVRVGVRLEVRLGVRVRVRVRVSSVRLEATLRLVSRQVVGLSTPAAAFTVTGEALASACQVRTRHDGGVATAPV